MFPDSNSSQKIISPIFSLTSHNFILLSNALHMILDSLHWHHLLLYMQVKNGYKTLPVDHKDKKTCIHQSQKEFQFRYFNIKNYATEFAV